MKKEDIDSAIAELKEVLYLRYGEGVELFLFGSVARDEYRADSDIDILVLMPRRVDTQLEVEVIDLLFEVELKYNVVFGLVIHEKEFWESPRAAVMPFSQNVRREALRL